MTQLWTRRELLTRAGILAVLPAVGLPRQTAFGQGPGKELQVLSADPPNYEPHVDRLVENWITPVEQFYVRSHAKAPRIDPAAFRLSVEGLVDLPLSLSLKELSDRFSRVSATCTMTCAGNRRTEHIAVKPLKGVPWGPAAVGNAVWSGFRLSDLLKAAGAKAGATHVWFEGLDEISHDGGTIPFGGSIPIKKALSDTDAIPGAIVCDRMHDKPLIPDHGAPLRMVVPGYIGARSVKWLGRIVVSNRPSPNHYLAGAYKLIYENTPEEWEKADPLMEYRLNSVIAQPAAKAKVAAGPLAVKGYALPPGHPGVTVAKVELSADGGKTWSNAKLTSEPREYCWQLWEAQLPVMPPQATLIVRATDSAGHVQPETVRWNHKGYMFNAWHKVDVHVGA